MILAIAAAGLRPLGQVRAPIKRMRNEQVWKEEYKKEKHTVEDSVATVEREFVLELLLSLSTV